MTALLIGAALAVAALVYVLFPLFDAVAPSRLRVGRGPALAPESAIDALREIEFDRATGKLSDDDYAALKAEYTRTALVELRARDSADPARRALVTSAVTGDDAVAPDVPVGVDASDPVEAASERTSPMVSPV